MIKIFQKKCCTKSAHVLPSLLSTPQIIRSTRTSRQQSSPTPSFVRQSCHSSEVRKQSFSQVNQDLAFQNKVVLPSPQESKKQLTSLPQEAKMHQSPTKQQPLQHPVKQQQYSAVEQELHSKIEHQQIYTAKQQRRKRSSQRKKKGHVTDSILLSKQAGTKNLSSQKLLCTAEQQKGSNTAIQSKVGPPVLQLSPTASSQQQKQSPWKPLEPVIPISLASTTTASKSSQVVRSSHDHVSLQYSEPLQNRRNIDMSFFISPELEASLYTVPMKNKMHHCKTPFTEGKDNIHFSLYYVLLFLYFSTYN